MNRQMMPHAAAVAFAVILCLAGGCTFVRSAGSLRTESLRSDPVVLHTNLQHSFYLHDLKGQTSFVLSDVALQRLMDERVEKGQFLHVQLLWLPQPGSTPMEPSATNASIRYVVISNGEIGIYSGAGFALPEDELGSRRVTLTLRDATLQLQEATPGFNDLLSPAQMTGTFTATLDENKARQYNRAASQLVTNGLGKTRLVLTGETVSPQSEFTR